jgi:hypothetical protein
MLFIQEIRTFKYDVYIIIINIHKKGRIYRKRNIFLIIGLAGNDHQYPALVFRIGGYTPKPLWPAGFHPAGYDLEPDKTR